MRTTWEHSQWIMSHEFFFRGFCCIAWSKRHGGKTAKFSRMFCMYVEYRKKFVLSSCLLNSDIWKQWKSWIAPINSLRGNDFTVTFGRKILLVVFLLLLLCGATQVQKIVASTFQSGKQWRFVSAISRMLWIDLLSIKIKFNFPKLKLAPKMP